MPAVLQQRLLFGPLMVALLVAGLALDEWVNDWPLPEGVAGLLGHETAPPGVVIFLAVVPLSWLAAIELAAILRANGIQASARVSAAAALVGLVVSCLVPSEADAVASVATVSSAAVIVLVGSLLYFSRHQSFEGVVAAAGGTLLAFVYLGLMFGFLLALRREHSVWTILWVLMTTKSCDIGAYFVGRAVGRHKLIRWLSPGKTWEGLVGGVALSAAVGTLGAWALASVGIAGGPGLVIGAAAGVAFGLLGQVGDLLASLLKRDAGMKDSGHSLPGFGGILDVLDSPLLVMPAAYWILRFAPAADLAIPPG